VDQAHVTMELQSEMNRVVQMFVAHITELARRAALDMLESAFGGRASREAVVTVAGAGRGRPRGDRGVKRSAEDLEPGPEGQEEPIPVALARALHPSLREIMRK
jgi:hypothetical protein